MVTTADMDRTAEIDEVIVDHLGPLRVKRDALERHETNLVLREGLPAVNRLPIAVLATVIAGHPVDVLLLELLGIEVREGVIVAVEPETCEAATLREPRPTIDEDEMRETLIRDELLTDPGDRREILVERIELQLASPTLVPQTLCLLDARIVRFRSDTAGGETPNEFLDLGRDARQTALQTRGLDLVQLGNVTNAE